MCSPGVGWVSCLSSKREAVMSVCQGDVLSSLAVRNMDHSVPNFNAGSCDADEGDEEDGDENEKDIGSSDE